MDKKELKFYEAPACEVVELQLENRLLAGSVNPEENPFSDSTYESTKDE